MQALSLPPPTQDAECSDLCADSRKAKAHCAFFCLSGAKEDGHRFAKDAYDRGARIFFCQTPLSLPADAQVFSVENTRLAYAEGCACFFRTRLKKEDARPFFLVGITGTKGKTTLATYLFHILSCAGKRCALIGTNGIVLEKICLPTANTTPDPYTLHRTFSACEKARIEVVILEVSSQAILQGRTYGLHFDIAVFTNLSPDHLGGCEHRDFEEYKACKKSLFSHCDLAILNQDADDFSEFFTACACPCLTYAQEKEADFCAKDPVPLQTDRYLGISFSLLEKGNFVGTLSLSLPGRHNISNALGAIAAASALGVKGTKALRCALLLPVVGRYDYTALPNGAMVIIDYAHNAAALEAALCALRPFCIGRLICLFGSVGNRTFGRRFSMGAAASRFADACILTADDPDFESVFDICSQIAKAFPPSYPYCIIENREEAIRFALSQLQKGDLLLLAGKGNEVSQKICGKKIPFCDANVLQSYLKELC